jgi:hypothetical protein
MQSIQMEVHVPKIASRIGIPHPGLISLVEKPTDVVPMGIRGPMGKFGATASTPLGPTIVWGRRPPLEFALQKGKVRLIRLGISKPYSSLLLEARTLMRRHELIGDLIRRSLAILHLYEEDDNFGSKDERSSSHSGHKKIEMWQIVFSSIDTAHIYSSEGTTVDLLKGEQSESVMERNCHIGDRGDSLRTTVTRCNRFEIYHFL